MVVLGKDLPYEDTTLMDLMAAIDHVLVVVEIVDSRVTNWNIRIEDTVADNASSALVMLGQHPYKLNEIDLITAPMTLTANGKQVSQGVGANCLGNPLIAARWLAQTMANGDAYACRRVNFDRRIRPYGNSHRAHRICCPSGTK